MIHYTNESRDCFFVICLLSLFHIIHRRKKIFAEAQKSRHACGTYKRPPGAPSSSVGMDVRSETSSYGVEGSFRTPSAALGDPAGGSEAGGTRCFPQRGKMLSGFLWCARSALSAHAFLVEGPLWTSSLPSWTPAWPGRATRLCFSAENHVPFQALPPRGAWAAPLGLAGLSPSRRQEIPGPQIPFLSVLGGFPPRAH